MKEDALVYDKFINFYLSQGAASVIIYSDGDPPVSVAELPARVKVFVVEEEEKRRIISEGIGSHEALQRHVFLQEYAEQRADWMLVVDADEFVFAERKLSDFFDTIPGAVESVRFKVGEAVWGPSDSIDEPFGQSLFRFPLGRYKSIPASLLLYGQNYDLYRRGLLGHCSGKHAVRVGLELDFIGCHFSVKDGDPLGAWTDELGFREPFVAHYDAICYQRWHDKISRRISGETVMRMAKSRRAQVARTELAIQQSASRELFLDLYSVSSLQVAMLKVLGGIKARELFQDGSDRLGGNQVLQNPI